MFLGRGFGLAMVVLVWGLDFGSVSVVVLMLVVRLVLIGRS